VGDLPINLVEIVRNNVTVSAIPSFQISDSGLS
jgi:hypothetical protein